MKSLGIAVLILESVLLTGCIDAVAIAALTRNKNLNKSAAPAPAPPDPLYHVWIASIPDVAAALAQETQLQSNGGVPDPAVWSEIGTGGATGTFVPSQTPGTYNAILIQASAAQTYHLDAVESLNVDDSTKEAASGTVYDNLMTTNPTGMRGAPDGATADMTAGSGTNACVFTVFAGSISRFRVSIWSSAPTSGDVLRAVSVARAGNQRAGGAFLGSTGTIYVTFDEPAGANRNVLLGRFDGVGNLLGTTSIVTGVSAAAGSHSVALHTDGTVYVSATTGTGAILVRKYTADLSVQLWQASFSSGLNSDRTEAHGLTVDASGNAIIAGGANTATNGIDLWMRKLSSGAGATMWTQTPPPLSPDPASTWWRAVVTNAAGDVFSAGDLGSLATSAVETLTRKSAGSNGTALWSNQFSDPDAPPDVGNAIALDGVGSVYVAGALGTSSAGKNISLIKHSAAGFVTSFDTFDGIAGLDDELLGIAAESDGTIYAVGYETLPGPLQAMWIRKYDPTGAVVWTRTYSGAGNTQAVNVLLDTTSIIVMGAETIPGGETDLHIRRYAK